MSHQLCPRCPLGMDSCPFVLIRGSQSAAIDRSLIDPDRPQTIDHQDQSTSDRFLKSEPFKPEIAKTPPRPTIHPPLTSSHLSLTTGPLVSRGLQKFPAHPQKISPPQPSTLNQLFPAVCYCCFGKFPNNAFVPIPNQRIIYDGTD